MGVGEDKIKERFDNGGGEMEHIFREKFLQNLNFVENLVRAWRDDNLDLETFGINGNFIADEPASFQKELLQGIGFLQERIQRSESDPDAITVVSKFSCNGTWISN